MEKKFKLPKEFAEKWLAALRSGQYQKGRGSLYKNNNTYCCLGVAGALCDIPTDKLEYEGFLNIFRFNYDIPLELIDEKEESFANSLITLNDGLFNRLYNQESKIHSFLEIANWIEENVEFY